MSLRSSWQTGSYIMGLGANLTLGFVFSIKSSVSKMRRKNTKNSLEVQGFMSLRV
jgi:hypothetical protein